MDRKEELGKLVAIAKRAEGDGLLLFNRASLIMDLDRANDQFDLRLGDFLVADDSNFIHDIVGIQQNLDRGTGQMKNFFVPRYSR